MALGARIRALLGDRRARQVGALYRAVFADMEEEALMLAENVPRNAHVLDIGGGDGVPLNGLLGKRPDVTAVSIDPAPIVGQWIDARHADRVTCLPRTTLDEFLASDRPRPDVALLCDVMHHIPESVRPGFVASIARLAESAPGLKLIVKDVEPGYPRAVLGYWADLYITGDTAVKPIGRAALRELLGSALPDFRCTETRLFERDSPNYALLFER